MINIENEELLTLVAATKRLPPNDRTGKLVHIATVHRWCSLGGVGGVQLETVKIGGVRYTSAEALRRFVARCTDPDVPVAQPAHQRQKAIEKADRELAEAGIT